MYSWWTKRKLGSFLPSYFVFTVRYHSTNAPHSHVSALYSWSTHIDINTLDIIRHFNSVHLPLLNVNIKTIIRGQNRSPSSGQKKERPAQMDPKDKGF